MIIDVSEIKTFRSCERKWAFSSRNKMHLRSIEQPAALRLGIAFHKAMEYMYEGFEPDTVELAERYELAKDEKDILDNMVGGYLVEIIPQDLAKYKVVDIEHKFRIPTDMIVKRVNYETGEITVEPLIISGSIDVVLEDRKTSEVFGMEHKSVRNWRPELYDILDEQPQLYYRALLHDYNICSGVLLNQVKKLKTKFQHKRTKLSYTEGQLKVFMRFFHDDCNNIINKLSEKHFRANPDYMKCSMCQYSNLCVAMHDRGVSDVTFFSNDEVLEKYGLEKRLIDHLEEK